MNEEHIYFGTYTGRNLKEGLKKDGVTKWTQYELSFKPKEGRQYGFSIKTFAPINNESSLQVDQLVEGNFYKVAYSDGGMSQYNTPYKNFNYIIDATQEDAIQHAKELLNQPTPQPTHPMAQQTIPQSASKVLDLAPFQTFRDAYFKTIEKQGKTPSVSHLIHSYLLTYDKDYVLALVNLSNVAMESYELEHKQPVEETVIA